MNNLDFKAAKETILEKRVPFFEYVAFKNREFNLLSLFNRILKIYKISNVILKHCRLRPITEEISAAELTNQADTEWSKNAIVKNV